ncbi:DUF4393 domain-containing protein [Lentilactobacillus kefiri]|uniref:DUF4393 domain-containing protein n=2 Tax=Lentilactobacillus kefiri TaxID=33962 RepID=A0A8E1RI71_LENKE|nr:DUF4393 domain-containing protein [Lentilactobacillus kefiri]KRL73292.1 hypothetical protein FD08_GL002777 [Lentilactobacillus parakefiri DSM 10551]KRM50077.1 hypothetical protein FC95_GL002126 [Lentilactobacillus kefiri DSM 20587 = JCM 5818]MCJ2162346.1 DUF4393 domain-containing protein [Lentilactobacillus kefiri]MCP9370213.1 DUF4393 domain-containing protein [Lentilactobacillus kefiri]MDH5108916.1 DUF4393 domain-containing protein [Lentilactobacillus kefiri]
MNSIDPNDLLKFGTAVIAAKALKEPLDTLNDLWFNIFGYRVKKARIKHEFYLKEYKNELEANLQAIPSDNIQNPKLSILGPALDASQYYIDEPELRKMFAKVAAGAFDNSKNNKIHQSFVQFLTEMSSNDANLLKYISGTREHAVQGITMNVGSQIPIMEMSYTDGAMENGHRSNILPSVVTEVLSSPGVKFSYRDGQVSMDTLLRMNLIEVDSYSLVKWAGKPLDEVFRVNDAIDDFQKDHNQAIDDLKKQLQPAESKQIDENTVEIEVQIPTDTPNNLKDALGHLQNMRLNKTFRTVSLTAIGKNFCEIVFGQNFN